MEFMLSAREFIVERASIRPRDIRFSSFQYFDSAFLSSQDATCPSRQQLSSHHIQVSQREHRERAHGVLVQPPIAHLRKSPQALNHAEGEFAASAASRTAAVDRFLVLAQRVLGFRPPVDPIPDTGMFALLSVILAPVSL